MKNIFLTRDHLSVPGDWNILTEKEFNSRLPQSIGNLINSVKNKLIYRIKDRLWNF